MTEAARALSAQEVIELIGTHIAAYRLEGGPNRKEEDVELARRVGLKVEAISTQWDDALAEAGVEPTTASQAIAQRLALRPVSYAKAVAKPKPPINTVAVEGPPKIEVALQAFADAKPRAETGFVSGLDKAIEAREAELRGLAKRAVEAKPVETVVKLPAEVGEPKVGEVIEPKRISVEDIVSKNELVAFGPGRQVGFANADERDLLKAMNERHAVIGNVGGKCRVLEWVPSELDPGALIASFQSKLDFLNRYAHRLVGWKRDRPMGLGEWWFDHAQRADYRGMIFKPGKPAVIERPESGKWLNLWRGWGVVPQKGQWPLLRDHVEQILSAGDPTMADYTIRWAAWGFQHPDERTEAALAVR